MLTRFPRFLAIATFAVLATALPAAAHHAGDEHAAAAANAVGAAEVTLTGTIDELVVVDRVNDTTLRYPILRQSDGKRVALRGDAVQTVEAGAQVGVTGSQTGTMFTVSSVKSIKSGSKAAPVGTAQVAGKFMVAHADNFETGTSQFFYTVFDAQGGVVDVAMPFLPGSLATGMQVVVDGTSSAGGTSIVPDRITIQSIPVADVAALGPVTTNYLVIPIKFPISGSPGAWVYNADPFTPAALNTQVFGTLPTKSASEYYKEASYGQQLLSGVTADDGPAPGGSHAFLKADVAAPAACNYTQIGTAAANAARLRGYPIDASGNPLAPYTGLLYVFNGVPNCGWAGLAYVGWARAWSNNTTALWVIGHELGHNFGLLHAGSLTCPGAAIGCGATGSVAEYGDPFNAMGNSGNTGHFDATQKEILGWITPTQVKTHAGGTATYTLSPIETGGLSTYAVKIPTSNANRTYWLEYRQPVGTFDAFITLVGGYPNDGAQVRIEYPFEKSSGSDDTEIIDMTPATPGNFHDAALRVGTAPFVDASTNVSINVLSATPGANGVLTVQVSTSAGSPTTTTMVSSLNPSTAGGSVTFTATVNGTSPTGTVNFTDGGAAMAGCSAVALVGAGNARTAACATATLTGGTHSIVASYSGDASNGASASAALSQVVNKKATTTTQVSSLNPSTSGASVTFTATVTGTAPTGNVNFTDGGTSIAGCSAVALTGAGNARTAACTTAGLTVASHNIVSAYAGDVSNLASTSTTLSQVVSAGGASTNVALAANGGVASASSVYSTAFPVASVNNGDRAGLNWGTSGGWNDGTASLYPDWVQIMFNGQKTIDHVIVYTVQDNYASPVDPPNSLTFSLYGVTAFQVQGWNGSAWVTLGSVSGNNLVKRQVNFTATTTDRIRVNVTGALAGYSRLTEIEAWTSGGGGPVATTTTLASSANPSTAGASVTFTATVTGSAPTGTVNFTDGGTSIATCAAVALTGAGNSRTATCSTSVLTAGAHTVGAAYGGDTGNVASSGTLSQTVNGVAQTNVALAGNGGVASASSIYSGIGVSFPVAAVINGDRAGLNWGNGGGWNDATNAVYPDWVQVNFSGTKTIDHVIVYTVQDNYASPVDPSNSMTFSLYGVTAFQVQGWNGSAWVTLGSAAGNNLVKRQVNFTATATDRIRVNVTGAMAGFSRITEIEAWGN